MLRREISCIWRKGFYSVQLRQSKVLGLLQHLGCVFCYSLIKLGVFPTLALLQIQNHKPTRKQMKIAAIFKVVMIRSQCSEELKKNWKNLLLLAIIDKFTGSFIPLNKQTNINFQLIFMIPAKRDVSSLIKILEPSSSFVNKNVEPRSSFLCQISNLNQDFMF